MKLSGTETTAAPQRASCLALWTIAFGSIACVLGAVPSGVFDLDRHSVPKEFVLHLAALVATVSLLSAAKEYRWSKLDAVLAAWLAVGVASGLAAENPWLAVRSLAVALSGVMVFWVSRALSRQGFERHVQGAVAVATVVAAATALAQAYGLDFAVFAETRAPGGTFGNRNFMAHVLALGLPTVLLAGLRTESAPRGWAALLGTAAITAALVLSRTRAAWLAVGLSTAVSLLLMVGIPEIRRAESLRRRALGLLAAGILGATLALVLPNTLDWRSSNPYLESALGVVNYKKGSGKGRLIQYRNTLGMLGDHPVLGVGPGNWPVEYSLYASRRDPSLGAVTLMPTNPWPSSDWVGYLVEWGPGGFVLLALALCSLWARGWSGSRRGANWRERADAITLVATTTSVAVVGTVDSVLHLAAPCFLFWAAAGSLAPPARSLRSRRPDLGLRTVAVLAALLAGGIAVARSGAQGAAILIAGRGWKTENLETASRLDPGNFRLHMLLANDWSRRGRCDRALPHALSASRLFPHLSEPKRLAAACGRPARAARTNP